MALSLKESLTSLVRTKYAAAKAARALTFAESHLAIVTVAGVPFQLRYCPSLAKKPTDQKDEQPAQPKKKIDPFENPDPSLFVTNVPDVSNPSHVLVLNKFPIIQNHVILATASSRSLQTEILDANDLLRTHQCLLEWEELQTSGAERKAFAFFNSGEHSGASQPHRHLQLLSVEDMREGDENKDWDLLVKAILQSPPVDLGTYRYHMHPELPFVHFGKKLPAKCDTQTLQKTYNDLFKAALASVRHFRIANQDGLPVQVTEGNGSPISYNLAMTVDGMVICARRKEGLPICREDNSEIEYVALNGTLLGGTLMVKNEETWNILQKDSTRLQSLLEAIGIPRTYENLNQDDFEPGTSTLKATL